MFSFQKIIFSFFIIISCVSFSYASLEQKIINDPIIDQSIKQNILKDQSNTESIVASQQMIDTLHKELTEYYNGEMVISSIPHTRQEQLSTSIDVLSKYMCVKKSTIISQFEYNNGYHPTIDSVIPKMGLCYGEHELLYQEAIQYYTIPNVGTLETVYIPLAQALGYKLDGFESYLQGNLLDMKSEQFFFEGHAPVDIVPLMDLTDTELGRQWRKKFDMVKIIAYVETTNYPFFDDNVMIAVLTKKDDNYIKITTPYQKIHYKNLSNITTLVRELFTRSVQDEIGDTIVSNNYFDHYYDIVIKDLGLEDNSIQKNKVRQYLTILWQNNEEPQGYIDFFVQSLKKDSIFKNLVELQLQQLSQFTD